MITNVVKRDGTKEPFAGQKLKQSIEAAARDAGLAEERIEEIASIVTRSVMKTLEGREDVPTAEIRERVLAMLEDIEPASSQAWQAYDKEHKKE